MATKFTEGWWGLALAVNDRLGTRIGESQMAHMVKDSGKKIGRRIGGKMFFTKGDINKAVRLVRLRAKKAKAVARAAKRYRELKRRKR